MRSRTLVFIVAAGLIPFAIAVALRWSDGYEPRAGDYAQYLLHAKALAEGRPYTDTGYIYTTLNSMAPEAYPPGLPAVLAPFVALGRHGSAAPKALMIFFGAWMLIAVAAAIFAGEGALVAASVAAVSALSQTFIVFSTHIGSDVPFCAFIWTLIALCGKSGRWSAGRTLAAAALGAAAVLFRAAGIALVPAALAFWFLRRRETGNGPLVSAAVWVAAFAAVTFWLPVVSGYEKQASMAPAAFLHAAASGVFSYRHAVFEAMLYPFPWNAANDAYHVASLAVVALGVVLWLVRSKGSFVACFLVAYILVTLLYPFHTTRYLLPLFPVLVLGWLRGVEFLVRLALGANAGRRPAFVAACTALLIAAGGVRAQAAGPRVTDLPDRAPVQGVFKALENENVGSKGVRAVFFNPRVLTWETGIPAMGYFKAPPAQVISEFRTKGITDVVVGDLGTNNSASASIEGAIEAQPAAFKRVYSNGTFSVFHFDPAAVDTMRLFAAP